eukprot:6471262-Amphidinium_carterae.1
MAYNTSSSQEVTSLSQDDVVFCHRFLRTHTLHHPSYNRDFSKHCSDCLVLFVILAKSSGKCVDSVLTFTRPFGTLLSLRRAFVLAIARLSAVRRVDAC